MKKEINWEEVRVQAAIAMAPRCQELAQDMLMRGGDIFPCKTLPECVAVNAVIYANELVKELQRGQATDYYREGYRDALDKVRSALINGTNNIDRLHAIRILLQDSDNGQGDS